ncbi:MAG TPA: hypothetical protein VN622_09090 [Clostridia bacterium]|nr:hypothetical protein [Clostridia bacterium]
MNPQLVAVTLESLVALTKLLAELKQASGMTDEQLLDFAGTKGAETRAAAENFIATLRT